MDPELIDQLLEKLSDLMGLSFYEARAYSTLLLENNPTTRYDLAKKAHIPSPKIYDTIQKLYEKGLVLLTTDEVPLVVALDSQILLDRLRSQQESSLSQLRDLLAEAKREQDGNHMQYIWTLSGRRTAYDKAAEIIRRCRETLYIAAFEPDITEIETALMNASVRGVSIKAVVYGKSPLHLGSRQVVEHGDVDGVVGRTGGRWLALASDHSEVLVSYPMEGACESFWTNSPVLSLIISKYVQEHFYTDRPIIIDS